MPRFSIIKIRLPVNGRQPLFPVSIENDEERPQLCGKEGKEKHE